MFEGILTYNMMVTGTIYTQSNKTIEKVVDILNFCLHSPMILTTPGSLLGEMIRRIKPSPPNQCLRENVEN